MQKILIIGANSAIAKAVAAELSHEGASFVLAGRDPSGLARSAELVAAGGAAVEASLPFEACEFASHGALLRKAVETLGSIDLLLVAHGTLPDQASAEQSVEESLQAMDVNFRSVVSILTAAAGIFERQGEGRVAVVTSVAGDRGRRSNYVYGAAKAGLSAFLEGYRARMRACGVQVLDIRPGFVDSPMTAEYRKVPILWASPDQIARGVVRALRRDRAVVYLPWFWRWIMWVIRSLPNPVFLRLGI